MSAAPDIFAAPPVEARPAPYPRGAFVRIRRRRRAWPMRLCMTVCLGVLWLAPLPRASNLAQAWLFWAAVLGLVIAILSAAKARAPVSGPARVMVLLGIVFAWFALFQAAPLPGWRGGLPVETPGGTVTLNTLSFAPGATTIAAVRALSYVIFFSLMLQIARNPARAKIFGKLIFAGIAVQAALAIADLKLLGDGGVLFAKRAFEGMATGSFVNRNSLATFLGMGLVLGLALYGRTRSTGRLFSLRAERAAAGLGILTIAAALMLTQSRMGIGASLAAALLVIWRIRRPARAKALALVIGGGLVLGLGQFGVFDRLAELPVSDEHRAALYAQVAGMIRARPLAGYGLDSFPLVYQMFHAPPVTANFVWLHAHSTYLALWAEAGVIFGSLPMLAGGLALRALWRRARAPRPGRSMALAGTAALLLVGVHSLVDFSLEIQANMFMLLALVALGLGGGHVSGHVKGPD